MNLLLGSIIVLGVMGFMGALVLYSTAKRFAVEEDARIDEIVSLLPGANCGGCGFKGCRDFATQSVAKGSLAGFRCPVATKAVLDQVAKVLGVESIGDAERQVAVLRCNGSCHVREQQYEYEGPQSCAVIDNTAVGTRGCWYGCLGCGDCVDVCSFNALRIDNDTKLPVVDDKLCTACGACVAECPRHLFQLRSIGDKNEGRRVWVACSNKERGAMARKACAAACIACTKCAKTCPTGAITISENLAYIDYKQCIACGECVAVCPTGAILANIPHREVKLEKTESQA
ncbi:MAG: RnfABCDGE type electron transport complex subunit B [Muribaculaceae bacterium]|nr:RnfABCDGE type electron transport complex subunit B [Muribaculaceae bacterium]